MKRISEKSVTLNLEKHRKFKVTQYLDKSEYVVSFKVKSITKECVEIECISRKETYGWVISNRETKTFEKLHLMVKKAHPSHPYIKSWYVELKGPASFCLEV